MASQPETAPQSDAPAGQNSVEMPRPTVAPLVLSLGLVLLAAGAALGLAFLVVGALVLVTGLGIWVAALLPGRGHFHEPRVEPARRPGPVTTERKSVEQLRPGMPGYRVRLPETVHPISAGIKGGVIGGLVMPLPALLYGLLSGHGIWYPVNLLAGMVLPGVGNMTDAQLEQFSLSLLLTGMVIHATMSVVFGLIYGVLLPTLPDIATPAAGLPSPAASLAWGGLLFPSLWTGVSYSLMGVVNPVLAGASGLASGSSFPSSCSAWSPRSSWTVRKRYLSHPRVVDDGLEPNPTGTWSGVGESRMTRREWHEKKRMKDEATKDAGSGTFSIRFILHPLLLVCVVLVGSWVRPSRPA